MNSHEKEGVEAEKRDREATHQQLLAAGFDDPQIAALMSMYHTLYRFPAEAKPADTEKRIAPTIQRTVAVIWERLRAGEDVESVERDYGLEPGTLLPPANPGKPKPVDPAKMSKPVDWTEQEIWTAVDVMRDSIEETQPHYETICRVLNKLDATKRKTVWHEAMEAAVPESAESGGKRPIIESPAEYVAAMRETDQHFWNTNSMPQGPALPMYLVKERKAAARIIAEKDKEIEKLRFGLTRHDLGANCRAEAAERSVAKWKAWASRLLSALEQIDQTKLGHLKASVCDLICEAYGKKLK